LTIAAAKEEMLKKFEQIIKNLEKNLNEEKTKNLELEARIKKLEKLQELRNKISFLSQFIFYSTSQSKSTEHVAILNANTIE
jgi:hypothetical protein